MYFPVDQDFGHSLRGQAFTRKYGVVGKGVYHELLCVLADISDGHLPTSDLHLFIESSGIDGETCTAIILDLISADQLRYDEARSTIFNPLITASKAELERKKDILNKNKKLKRSSQMSAQTNETSAQTSVDVMCSDIISKDPSKKKFLDAVLLSDEQFEYVEKRYAKDNLTKRDVQRGIELLNAWFLTKPHERAKRNSDHRALVTWPLQRVIEENSAKQRLHNAENAAAKYNGGAPPGAPVLKAPPRGFELAEEQGAKHDA